jgi:hypothetical protein
VKTLDARMKKRPKLGEGARSIRRGAKRTDVDELAQVSEPTPAMIPETPEADPAAVQNRSEFVVATYRLKPEHIAWLARRAVELKIGRGSRGRADASAVLRELLDHAITE